MPAVASSGVGTYLEQDEVLFARPAGVLCVHAELVLPPPAALLAALVVEEGGDVRPLLRAMLGDKVTKLLVLLLRPLDFLPRPCTGRHLDILPRSAVQAASPKTQ